MYILLMYLYGINLFIIFTMLFIVIIVVIYIFYLQCTYISTLI